MKLDRERLRQLQAQEEERFARERPRSQGLAEQAREHLTGGVPMSWMVKWPGPFPVFVEEAQGAHFTCADGIDHVDLCLGDTGAMCGHSPAATVAAVREQVVRGITSMLPTADAAIAAGELSRRFGLPQWQFTLTATDANRHVIRYARHLTGRAKVVVIDYCYHGTVDETFAVLSPEGTTVSRPGNIGAPVPLDQTTVVVPFNDLASMEAALAGGDIAAVLLEPAMTNIGIVLPEPGYHEALRALTRRYGTLLVIDETHTLCAGPGGCTGAWQLEPDVVVVGKTIGGGIPAAAFGLTSEISARVQASVELPDIDVGGVGGTLAGNALSMAAVRATLTQVLTDDVFAGMEVLAERWADGVQGVLDEFGVPWHVTRLGCRAEYAFSPQPPRTGGEAAASDDFELQQYLHLQALNRRVLLTPFHNMALISPATTEADVDQHTVAFREAVQALFG
ncbi:aspartate aminotransferase family protein [Kineosporia sp. NBRC 101677]|uniref:aspartate aminotransferase family protein n=1 Tax=Kineosporia sp. NBRC 101677 TaxID=3032197 RepID=UPI0024A34F67|nr:aspartate aminotransferase family protein [Kineosporia sp. NBRC 101677]GLY16231.1 aspartate aminotransferase family protein [Kineosporia sp. NBRC 101677]